MSSIKTGLDYFPFYTSLMRDRKFRPIRMEFGYLGIMVYICLLCVIYSDNGYYYSTENDNTTWDVIELLQGPNCPSEETVSAIIDRLVERGLFSKSHYESKILTSRRIQDIYYRSTIKRTGVTVDPNIWMLTEDEMLAVSKNSKILSSLGKKTYEPAKDPVSDNLSVKPPYKERGSGSHSNVDAKKRLTEEYLKNMDEIYEINPKP